MGGEDLEAYKAAVVTSLKMVLGESGTTAILFYVGEPNPETFETKLKAILGHGASIVIQELNKQPGSSVPHKRHWLGLGRAFHAGLDGLRASLRPRNWCLHSSLADYPKARNRFGSI